MGEELAVPKIPCVFCGHGNPPGHRFCGMCGKALPDLVKQTKPVQGALGSAASLGGMGAAGRPVVPPANPVAPKVPVVKPAPAPPVRSAPALRVENPNRDLSYLLHDNDPVVAPTNRMPFVIGGLILAAVAGFFILRDGGKKAPVVDPAAGDPAVSQTAPAEGKAETPKTESAKTEPATAKTEPEKAEPAPEVSAPASEVQRPRPDIPAPVVAPPRVAAPVRSRLDHAARAARTPKRASPSRQAEEAPEDDTASPVSSAGGDCESQLPSLRKAAARGDAKARANLGLAYYAGRCVPRDLPTSYHWYALALRTEPNSPLVSAQLEAIWKQMSPAEKQLALKAQ
jgi:hypothetical protein